MGWPTIGSEGDGESNWTSSGVIGERSIEDEEVSLVDGVLEGALGALVYDEKDDVLVMIIWKGFMERKWFENGMSLN
ncbi:hypothetical protein Tco_1463833 [Tanacetum coccineum]